MQKFLACGALIAIVTNETVWPYRRPRNIGKTSSSASMARATMPTMATGAGPRAAAILLVIVHAHDFQLDATRTCCARSFSKSP